MEKLIELLNEYEKWKSEKCGRGNYVWCIDKENKSIFASRFPDGAYICEDESRAIIICKGYNFIKWLVDNDKIERDKIIEKSGFIPIVCDKVGNLLNPTEEQELLMLLSIQENPVEFLISVLK